MPVFHTFWSTPDIVIAGKCFLQGTVLTFKPILFTSYFFIQICRNDSTFWLLKWNYSSSCACTKSLSYKMSTKHYRFLRNAHSSAKIIDLLVMRCCGCHHVKIMPGFEMPRQNWAPDLKYLVIPVRKLIPRGRPEKPEDPFWSPSDSLRWYFENSNWLSETVSRSSKGSPHPSPPPLSSSSRQIRS